MYIIQQCIQPFNAGEHDDVCLGNDCQQLCITVVFCCESQASVDLNIKWRGVLYTPLHVAVTQSYWSVVECLVGWGAALDPVGNDGDTALHMAINVKTAVRPTSPTLKRVISFHIYSLMFMFILFSMFYSTSLA